MFLASERLIRPFFVEVRENGLNRCWAWTFNVHRSMIANVLVVFLSELVMACIFLLGNHEVYRS